ncbi:uncharacterized protein LOC127240200 [Andrographis paniculata]|uniref:uncharacterized protein LOC127240200 n=1 Tax=Andrographis paniculata TaxID=175694 RepID=UPI0021E86355|nr:uncharacterized protein LOC127240200 [Andrographis paniculata]XP_051114692.1 uncharacterized protein LOC127240200 [Andrographis paniculata]XP_051114694.1 uncharacterized protein LOC127240200 [Andrographis paniculata]
MESKMEEALRAKSMAEKQFSEKDFISAKNYALKAQMMCPELEGISQMVATFGVYVASEAKINGEYDFYSILGVDPTAEKPKLKKQYKKMAVMLHPDKNRTVGADGAFRLVSEAWTQLSDGAKRSSYDQRRSLFAGYNSGISGYDNSSKFPTHSRLDTFWTVCTSCHVQYEYLRKYVNKRLSCKNCRGVFVAVETGLAPMSSSFPYSTYTYPPENGYGSHGSTVSYVPANMGYCPPNGSTGHTAGYRPEYVSNISFQGNSTAQSTGSADPNGLSASSFVFCQANGEANKTKVNGKHDKIKSTGLAAPNGYTNQHDASRPRRGRPPKKIKVDFGSLPAYGHGECRVNATSEVKMANGDLPFRSSPKLSSPTDATIRHPPAVPVIDTRRLLISKARLEIIKKVEEMRLISEADAAEAEKRIAHGEVLKYNEGVKVSGATHVGSHPELKRSASMSITVPDSDFHDFDKDRSEECFKPKQIWALYDEEDGMPRLYCLIREIISVNPFKIYISYLSSKSDGEFGPVNWLDCGFTKSCGSFRVFHSETVEHVNIFSHLLSKEKAGRGGCVRIYPRLGDIWAVYRNWSPDWNRATPAEVRHQYEMVEVLADYSDENGVWVTPLIKLEGYKTVYQRNPNTSAIRWIPRREMLRFSHQVPSCSLKVEGKNLPDGCWDLDPAATPEELLQGEAELLNGTDSGQSDKATESPPEEHRPAECELGAEEVSAAKRCKVESEACDGKENWCGAFLKPAAEVPQTETISEV